MYVDTMQQIYSSVTKVLVESRQGGNMLFLPLDRILQQVAQGAAAAPADPAAPAVVPVPVPNSSAADARARDGRSREREGR
jgi:membrane protease subunit HflK